MNDGFKQRFVGVIVLVSLVLILWPIMFSQTIAPVVDKRSQIPPAPSFEKYTVPRPSHLDNVEPINQPKQSDVTLAPVQEQQLEETQQAGKKPADTQVTEKGIDKPTLDNQGLPVSWVLQVASFKNESNAHQLRDKLKKKGYKAYTISVKKQGVESVRVYVGPKLTRAAFDEDKKAIDKAFNVQSLVVRFRP